MRPPASPIRLINHTMIVHALLTMILGTSLSVDRGDYRIHAQVIGEGQPLVAIAGGPGFSGQSVWGVGFGARKACKTYLFDQLGTGQSQMKHPEKPLEGSVSLLSTVDDLEALRKATGHKKWIVFGQSWGVIVALVYAARNPGAVDHLVLASVPGLGFDGRVLGTNLAKSIPDEVEKQIADISLDPAISDAEKADRALQLVIPYYFHDPMFGRNLAKRAPVGMFAPHVFLALQENILGTKGYAEDLRALRRTKFPVTMIQGHQDPCGAAMPYLLKDEFFPRAKVYMLDRVGHFSWMEERELFFTVFHQSLKLPMPDYLTAENLLDNPAGDRELAEMEEHGWPFGAPASSR